MVNWFIVRGLYPRGPWNPPSLKLWRTSSAPGFVCHYPATLKSYAAVNAAAGQPVDMIFTVLSKSRTFWKKLSENIINFAVL